MAELSSHTLDHLSQTYDSILNNNLNDVMKFMTVWSLLLTVPTIVTGFYGMNVPLPAQHSPWGWIITIGITLALWLVMGLFLHRWMR
jgi:Mg2+ and Co2+ transporter CorA